MAYALQCCFHYAFNTTLQFPTVASLLVTPAVRREARPAKVAVRPQAAKRTVKAKAAKPITKELNKEAKPKAKVLKTVLKKGTVKGHRFKGVLKRAKAAAAATRFRIFGKLALKPPAPKVFIGIRHWRLHI